MLTNPCITGISLIRTTTVLPDFKVQTDPYAVSCSCASMPAVTGCRCGSELVFLIHHKWTDTAKPFRHSVCCLSATRSDISHASCSGQVLAESNLSPICLANAQVDNKKVGNKSDTFRQSLTQESTLDLVLRGTSCLSTKPVSAELWSKAFLVQSSAYTHVALCPHRCKPQSIFCLTLLVAFSLRCEGCLSAFRNAAQENNFLCAIRKSRRVIIFTKKKIMVFFWGAADMFLQMCQKRAVTCVHS